MVAWGAYRKLPESVQDIGRPVQYMTAGHNNAAVIIDGRLTVWGWNEYGLNNVTGIIGVSAVGLGVSQLIYL